MNIKNTEGLKVAQIKQLVQQGGKFVVFPYTISFILMTLKRNSDIYFIKPNEGTFQYSYPFVLLNFFIGWWGLPWGPIYTIGSIYKHIIGGTDITTEVLGQLTLTDPEGNRTTYNVPTSPNASNETANTGYNVPAGSNNANSRTEIPNNGYNVSGNMSADSSK
jgi:hypothetical protein